MQVERRNSEEEVVNRTQEDVGLKKVNDRGEPEEEAARCGANPAVNNGQQTVATSEETKPSRVFMLAGKYILFDPPEGCSLHGCTDLRTGQQLVCRVVGKECTSLISAHLRMEGHPRINPIHQVVLGEEFMYLIFPGASGDLHSHVRSRKRLRETEARRLFRQVAEAVAACHEEGVVLRDLKLRKFVFSDPDRTQLKLECLEDAVVLEHGEEDVLQDKRGCPAYVSPEILRSHARYSGRAADMWSLGVILYTMLVGRYPFNDAEHANLFMKISRGHFVIPECLSSRSKCLIRSLLRREPEERLTAEDVLIHPWLTQEERSPCPSNSQDHIVPGL